MVHTPKVTDNWSVSDDLAERPLIEIDKFYEQMNDAEDLTDDQAFEYMTFGAKLAQIKFKDEAELLSYRNDFDAALKFISILDNVDTKGIEPIGSVLEVYGGNQDKLRNYSDYMNKDAFFLNKNVREELSHRNKHYKDGYVVLPRAQTFNPDSE